MNSPPLDDESDVSVLHAACRAGRVNDVIALISDGSDVSMRNSSQQTPLHSASESGDISTICVLLDNGADVNAKDEKGRRPVV